jgi:hypothetical protein
MQEEETPSVEVLAASDKLVYDILLFVKKKYPQTDYELFRLKEYEAKCSYRHLKSRHMSKFFRDNHIGRNITAINNCRYIRHFISCNTAAYLCQIEYQIRMLVCIVIKSSY